VKKRTTAARADQDLSPEAAAQTPREWARSWLSRLLSQGEQAEAPATADDKTDKVEA
jgi:hypothetical protein